MFYTRYGFTLNQSPLNESIMGYVEWDDLNQQFIIDVKNIKFF